MEKLGMMSGRLKGVMAWKEGITPYVGRTWKFSSFSKTRGRSLRLAPTPRSVDLLLVFCYTRGTRSCLLYRMTSLSSYEYSVPSACACCASLIFAT